MHATTIRASAQTMRRRVLPLAVFGLVVAYAGILVVSLVKGIWVIDADGRPLPTDFIAFWAAGKLVLQGNAADAYDWTIHKDIAVAATGVDFSGHFAWLYPPTFLPVVAMLALMPYAGALLAWTGIGIAAYLAAIRTINGTWNATIAALAWPGVLWSVIVGQNGLIIAALLSAGLALVEKRPALAGILFGLLTFKPQFGLLIPIALVAGGYWRAIAWAAASTLALATASAVAYGAGSWVAFFQSLTTTSSAVFGEGLSGFHKIQSVYGYVRLLGGNSAAAWLAQGAFVAALGAGVAWLWRSRVDFDIRAAALAAATIAASPYAFMYDMAALGIPLAFLGRTGFSGKELAAVVLAGVLILLGPSPYLPVGLVAALIPLAIAASRVPLSSRRSAALAPATGVAHGSNLHILMR
jgi:hypothetical protein